MNTNLPDASEMAFQIKQKRISSVELVSQSLARIEQLDHQFNAFALVLKDRALAIAKARDIEISAGIVRGPLHGVPVAVKDLLDIQGYVSKAGSKAMPDEVAIESASVVKKLEQAGAVIVGKTNTVEFAFGGWGINTSLGTPKNPYDIHHHLVAGGSSSGSAIAVATNMVPLAIGTDTGGSVRIPCSFCGLFGHKSTIGLVGKSGLKHLSQSHDSIGPMARSARDVEMCLKIILGNDDADKAVEHLANFHTDHTSTFSYKSLAVDKFNDKKFHIALLDDPSNKLIDTEVNDHFQSLISTLLAKNMISTSTIKLPQSLEKLCEQAGIIASAEAFYNLAHLTLDETMPIAPEIRARINYGKNIRSFDFLSAVNNKKKSIKEFQNIMQGIDFLLMPSTPITAKKLDLIDENDMSLSIFNRFANFLNLCASAAPIGQDSHGLPIGLQIVSVANQDAHSLFFLKLLEQHLLAKFTSPNPISMI